MEEEALREVENRLKMLEDGKGVAADCACQAKPETKEQLELVRAHFLKSAQDTKKYDLYTKLIEDFLNANEPNFNQFLKLTVTSTMNLNDKIAKINKSLRDKNQSLLKYLGDIVDKNYRESCFHLINNYLSSSTRSPEQTLELFDGLKTKTESETKDVIDDKVDGIEYLKEKIKGFCNLENLSKA